MEDFEIIALFFARDERAIGETARKYGHLCSGIARGILGCESDVEECVNDTYLGAWNAIPPQNPENFSAFLARITRNLSLKRLRYHSVFKRSALTDVSLSELAELLPDDRLAADMDEGETERLIYAFLRAQKQEARCIFIRKYWFFDTVADIAARYGIGESKVKITLYRTRNALRDYLKKEGIVL